MTDSRRGFMSFLVLCVTLSSSEALMAQTRLPTRTPVTAPTVMAGPPTLAATSWYSAVTLTWTWIEGATGYRIIRVANTGESEQTIAEGPPSDFVAPPTDAGEFRCTRSLDYVDTAKVFFCRFRDIDQKNRGWVYSYRVYALFNNGVVSPGSPVASVRIQ